jgi:hypothetical protein
MKNTMIMRVILVLMCVVLPAWRGRPALASRGHPGLAYPNDSSAVAPEVQGQDALATAGRQGPDALATLGGAAGAALAQEPARAYKQLKYPKLADIKVPDVQRLTMPNGMQLFVLEDHDCP